jgi:ABC-2 type transport system ATP-binding protein
MIEFAGVSKRFGNIKALNDISMVIPKGKIVGLFGPNGAGKSTSLKMMAGLNWPDSGEVLVDKKLPRQMRNITAFLPEIDYLYNWWTIKEAASFLQAFYSDWEESKYRELLKFLNLDEDMKIKKISKGQRAKAKLLLTMSRQAPYLLMDEPLSGIDILTREEIINTLIHDYRAGEQTIVISTHEINEVESLVDEVIFLNQGKVRLAGNADELRAQKGLSLVEIMKEEFRHVE